MKIFIQNILGKMAQAVLWRHKPFVIAVTGSIGKTTAKDALFTILSARYSVRTNIANYNNEFGVPLTIIGTTTAGRSILGWMGVFIRWFFVMLMPRYPKILILEFGIDHVGDMDYLIGMTHPDMGIVTVVDGVHAEKLGSVATIAREKGALIRKLPAAGIAVLNFDDSRVLKMSGQTRARVVTYSTMNTDGAQMRISDVVFDGAHGISFKVNEKQTTVPVRLPHIIGTQMLPSILSAITAARAYGMNLVEIAQALYVLKPPNRRMNITVTSENVTIIDDTYNAAPASMRGALATLGEFPIYGREIRRIAVLGDMRELGSVAEEEHRALVHSIIVNNIDAVVCVGPLMSHLYNELSKACDKEYQICAPYYFETTDDAVAKIAQIVTPGDIVLCKGSNGMHMWDVVERLM